MASITAPVPSLTAREIIAAMPILSNWRNSKGRLMPLHLRSAPGTGKTMLPAAAIRVMARANPGRWVGYGVHNLGLKTPADVGGFLLFDTIDGQKTGVYSRPDLFGVQRAVMFTPSTKSADSGTWSESTRDDAGQPLYWGSTIQGQPLTMGMVLLDEFDQADVEVRKVAAPLLDEGRITTHHLPRDVMVWAASNRAKDASGTGRGLAFLTNRWASIELTPDPDSAINYLRGINIEDTVEFLSPTLLPELDEHGRVVRKPHDVDFAPHPAYEAFVRQQWDTFIAGVPSDPNSPFLTLRSGEAMANLFDVCLRLSVADESGAMDPSLSFADSFIPRRGAEPKIEGITGDPVMRWRVFQALAGGTVGVDNASQFIATLELYDEIPTIADIVRDPLKARVSDKTDAQYITAYMVANAMRPDNGSALMRYAKRLQVSFYHNAVLNAIERNGSLLMVPEIGTFFQENPDAITRVAIVKARAQGAVRK